MPDEPSRPGSILFVAAPATKEPVAEQRDDPAPQQADSAPAPVRPVSRLAVPSARWVRRLRRLGLRPLWRRRRRRLPPGVQRSFMWGAIASVAVVAGILVSVTTIDLGPSLRTRAEQAFAGYIDRPVTIGRLSTYLRRGGFSSKTWRSEASTRVIGRSSRRSASRSRPNGCLCCMARCSSTPSS